MSRRIACAEVPLFPLAARLRSEPELLDEAVAVLAGNGNGARVVAATRRARRAGVRPGFTLSQARSRLPKLIARPRDGACEQAAEEAMLDIAESLSPRVEHGGEGRVFLDIEGLDRHYPGDDPELALARDLQQTMESRAGMPARVGVASSKLAARLAAGRPDPPAVIPAGREAAFLATVPIDRVTPQASTLATLGQWGIHSLGELAELPEAEVISRLGEAGSELQAIARGEDPRPLVPRTPPPAFREGMELEWPLVSLEPFLFVARAALERLVARMATRALACRRLQLSMELEPDGRHERSITLPSPTRDIKTLLGLLKLDLEAQAPGAPILAFHLIAHPDRPRRAQLSLFGPEALSPERLATTLGRLFAILGPDRVGSPETVDGHCPERFALRPYDPPPPPPRRPPTPRGRGLLGVRVLRPPLPVEVMTDALGPSGPRDGAAPPPMAGRTENANADAPSSELGRPCQERPISLCNTVSEETAKRPKIRGAVKVASGPWAMEEGWWAEKPVGRDYWDVELSGGGLYRLYRERQSGDWFVDGIYD